MLGYSVDVSEADYIRDHNGIPTLQNAQFFINENKLAVSATELSKEKQRLFAECSTQAPSPLMNTAFATLQAAQQKGFKMAIATGAGRSDIQRSLEAHKIGHFFDAVATRSDVAHGKPAPDVYLLACDRLNIDPSDAIAFEDTAAGIASAKSAGLNCIAVPSAYSQHQDLSQADQTCTSLWAALSQVSRY